MMLRGVHRGVSGRGAIAHWMRKLSTQEWVPPRVGDEATMCKTFSEHDVQQFAAISGVRPGLLAMRNLQHCC